MFKLTEYLENIGAQKGYVIIKNKNEDNRIIKVDTKQAEFIQDNYFLLNPPSGFKKYDFPVYTPSRILFEAEKGR